MVMVGALPAAQTSDQVFKNVQVLKGIPVDDFMGTMGLMSAAIGYDCSECHIGAATEKVYGEASLESDDVITQAPGQPTAESIIDKYLQAVGGRERLDSLKSYI